MPVFRINKNTNYTVMSNYHLKDNSLSLKAKGILSLTLREKRLSTLVSKGRKS